MNGKTIPENFPVQPLPAGHEHANAQCGVCLRWWDDTVSTSVTPAPAGRCPFEAFHEHAHHVTQVCAECGSEDVRYDAMAMWDVQRQEWILDLDTMDSGWCNDCMATVEIESKEIEE